MQPILIENAFLDYYIDCQSETIENSITEYGTAIHHVQPPHFDANLIHNSYKYGQKDCWTRGYTQKNFCMLRLQSCQLLLLTHK